MLGRLREEEEEDGNGDEAGGDGVVDGILERKGLEELERGPEQLILQ